MAKVTIGQTPTERVVEAAKRANVVTDSAGRELTIRKLDSLDKFRLFKALGPADANNQPVLGYAMLAASVTAVNGVLLPPMLTSRQIEATISQLGDHGIEAAAEFLQREMAGGEPEPSAS
jgi:hypothetical protein